MRLCPFLTCFLESHDEDLRTQSNPYKPVLSREKAVVGEGRQYKVPRAEGAGIRQGQQATPEG